MQKLTRKIKQAIAGTVLGATLFAGAAAADWNINTQYHSDPLKTGFDTILAEDSYFDITYTGKDKNDEDFKWTFQHQNNWNGYGSDKNYTQVKFQKNVGDWHTSTGVKASGKEGEESFSAATLIGKNFGTEEQKQDVTFVGVAAEGFAIAGVHYDGEHIDAAVHNFYDFEDGLGFNLSAGYHRGDNGLWLTRNQDDDEGAAITVSTDNFSAYAFGKNRDDGTAFGATQMVFGKSDSGLFTESIGRFTSYILSDQVPRPNFHSLDSYLSNGNLTGQAAYVKDDLGDQYEVQLGAKLFEKNGWRFALGAGKKFTDAENFAVGEAHVVVPFGKEDGWFGDGTLNITGRFADKEADLESMISVIGKWSF